MQRLRGRAPEGRNHRKRSRDFRPRHKRKGVRCTALQPNVAHARIPALRGQRESTLSALRRAGRGDADALDHLYRQYAPGVFAYVRRILRNEYDAQDVTQQVFVKLATSLTSTTHSGRTSPPGCCG